MINGSEDEIDPEAQVAHYLLQAHGILPDEFASQSVRGKLFCFASVEVQRKIDEKLARKNASKKKRKKR